MTKMSNDKVITATGSAISGPRMSNRLIVPPVRRVRTNEAMSNVIEANVESVGLDMSDDKASLRKRLLLDSSSTQADETAQPADSNDATVIAAATSTEESYRKTTTKRLFEMLECPVCLDFLRKGPIFSCRNGHIVCTKCHPKLDRCPVCRSPDLNCRNHFAEKFALPLLDEEVLPCANHSYGCSTKDLGKKLLSHYPNCLYEQVICPAFHRHVCSWNGSLLNVVAHAGKNKCAQMLRSPDDRPFTSSIGDFNDSNLTIFQRTSTTYWKPVFFLSQTIIRFFLYLIIYRDDKGSWYLYVRSLAHNDHLTNLQVEIKVIPTPQSSEGANTATASSPDLANQTTEASPSKPTFTFTGYVFNSTISDADIVASGNYLLLRDEQVKLLRRDQSLFAYTISISRVINGVNKVLHPRPRPLD